MHIHSDFAILDVKDGRHELAKRIRAGEKFTVTFDLTLDTVHSKDDGVSIEFSGSVGRLSIYSVTAPAKEIA
jgi:hypothetical protein